MNAGSIVYQEKVGEKANAKEDDKQEFNDDGDDDDDDDEENEEASFVSRSK